MGEQILPYKIRLSYIDYHKNYELNFYCYSLDVDFRTINYDITLPIILSISEVERISHNIIYNARREYKTIEFTLPIKYCFLKPANVITLSNENGHQQLRIKSINLYEMELYIEATLELHNAYRACKSEVNYIPVFQKPELNINYLGFDQSRQLMYFIVWVKAAVEKEPALYISSKNNTLHSNFKKHINLNSLTFHAKIIIFKDNYSNQLQQLIDYKSELVIHTYNQITVDENAFWSNSYLIKIDKEFIAFETIINLGNGKYQLFGLKRNCYNSNNIFDCASLPGDDCVIIYKPDVISLNYAKYFNSISFKINFSEKIEFDVSQYNHDLQPLLISSRYSNNSLYLKWIARDFTIDNWKLSSNNSEIGYKLQFIKNNSITLEIHTNKTKLKINKVDISGATSVNIITLYENNEQSYPLTYCL